MGFKPCELLHFGGFANDLNVVQAAASQDMTGFVKFVLKEYKFSTVQRVNKCVSPQILTRGGSAIVVLKAAASNGNIDFFKWIWETYGTLFTENDLNELILAIKDHSNHAFVSELVKSPTTLRIFNNAVGDIKNTIMRAFSDAGDNIMLAPEA